MLKDTNVHRTFAFDRNDRFKRKLNIATTAMRGKVRSKWNEWSTPTVLTMITVVQNHKERMTKLKHKILSHSFSINCAVDFSMSHAMKWIYELYSGVCAPRFLDLSIRATAAQLRLHRCEPWSHEEATEEAHKKRRKINEKKSRKDDRERERGRKK